jgi:replicative DNA helicase
MSDLRESGALEQDADLIMLLYRPEYYEPDNEELKGKVEVIIAKQRNGPTGTVNLQFTSSHMRFHNLALREEPFAPPPRRRSEDLESRPAAGEAAPF